MAMSVPAPAADPAAKPAAEVEVEVELFGVPRVLAGRRSLPAAGRTLGELTVDLGRRCPALLGTVIARDTGWLVNGYVFVVDERFTREPAHPLTTGSAVLLVASAAGG